MSETCLRPAKLAPAEIRQDELWESPAEPDSGPKCELCKGPNARETNHSGWLCEDCFRIHQYCESIHS